MERNFGQSGLLGVWEGPRGMPCKGVGFMISELVDMKLCHMTNLFVRL